MRDGQRSEGSYLVFSFFLVTADLQIILQHAAGRKKTEQSDWVSREWGKMERETEGKREKESKQVQILYG